MEVTKEKITKEELKILAAKGYESPVFFCKTFLNDWFPDEMPWMHWGAIAILTRKTDFLKSYKDLSKIISNFTYVMPDDPEKKEHPIFIVEKDGSITLKIAQFALVKWPRGFSKTTIFNAIVIWTILYELKKFIMYISESSTHAEQQLATVKNVFMTNALIRSVFAPVIPERKDGKRWTANFIECLNGVKVKALGRGGQIRGSNADADRPDLILVDDVEDEESVGTSEQRAKCRKWFQQAVLGCLPSPVRRPDATVFVAGTLLHEDALLQYLEKDPQWTCMTFGAYDKQGELLWPQHMNEIALKRKKDSFIRMGNLAGYYMEYHNTLRDDESSKFKDRYIIHLHIPETDFVSVALALDPAISKKKTADLCAFAVTAMDNKGFISVLDILADRGIPGNEQVELFFMLSKKWNCTVRGIESVALQEVLIDWVNTSMHMQDHFFECLPIKHGNQKKTDRIEGLLQPRYAAGRVYHNRSFPEYESDLLNWPFCKKDRLDAVAMSVNLHPKGLAAYTTVGTNHDYISQSMNPFNKGREWRVAP